MEPIAVNFSALAIATLYYLWRDGYHMRLIRRRILHQRVAYMLWSTAQHAA